jgi:hypothetical protein
MFGLLLALLSNMREKLLGPDHPATLLSVESIAAVLSEKGEQMNQKVNRSKNMKGPGNAGTLLKAGLLFD